MLRITKIFTFDTAHRISNHAGACSQIHGHSYKLHVSVGSEDLEKKDMLMDFQDLKNLVQIHIIQHLDHAILLKKNKENEEIFSKYYQKVCWFETEPTAERMLLWMAELLIKYLPKQIQLKQLILFETESSYATWEINKR